MNEKDGPVLKACPFCGSMPKVYSNPNNSHYVTCVGYTCNVNVDAIVVGGPEPAIAAWNNRPGEAALEYMLGERANENDLLRKEVEKLKADLAYEKEYSGTLMAEKEGCIVALAERGLEIKRLRAALEEIATSGDPVRVFMIREIARKALEGGLG